jgi:hypothetical protein
MVIALLVGVAAVVAVASAVRSTWSPCGLSMLSSITPISERGRGNRYASTVAWFVVGAVVGGATLGAAASVLAAGVAALDLSPSVAVALGAIVVAAAAISDAPIGFTLPYHRRQVNEVWLDAYRQWVYGAGFGWQIGVGLATYVMTAGVYALVALAALTGSPVAALLLCTLFGLVRGLAILLTHNVKTPAELTAFHRRFMAIAPRVRDGVVAVLVGAAIVLFAGLTHPIVAVLPIALLVAATARRRRSTLHPA